MIQKGTEKKLELLTPFLRGLVGESYFPLMRLIVPEVCIVRKNTSHRLVSRQAAPPKCTHGWEVWGGGHLLFRWRNERTLCVCMYVSSRHMEVDVFTCIRGEGGGGARPATAATTV